MKRLILILALLVVAGCGGAATATERPDDPTDAPTEEPAPVIDYANFGVISFGKSYDEDTLLIVDERVKFKSTVKEIAWSAEFSRVPGATTIVWVVARTSSGGAETTLINTEQSVGSPDYTILANSIDLATLVDNKPGTYVMRYIESGDVLAEGTFTLVK